MQQLKTWPTRDGKFAVLEIARPDVAPGLKCIVPKEHSLEDEFDGAEPGESIVVTLREMTEEEIDDLPDFEGW